MILWNRGFIKVLLCIGLLFNVPMQTQAQDNRITIAIGSIRGVSGGRGSILKTMLTTSLIKEGRFILLEREGLADLSAESIMGRKNTALLEGADYVLLVDVTKFDVITKTGGAIFATGSSELATVEFDLRLVDVQTGRIVYTDSVADSKKGNVVVNIAGIGGQDAQSDLIGELLRPIVELQINLISKKLYPTKVISQKNRMIILNFGEDRFEVGNEIKVQEIGDPVFDQDTGILLYQDTTLLDTAIVFEVNAKIAKAYLVEYTDKLKVDLANTQAEVVLSKKGEPVVKKQGAINKLQKLYDKGK